MDMPPLFRGKRAEIEHLHSHVRPILQHRPGDLNHSEVLGQFARVRLVMSR